MKTKWLARFHISLPPLLQQQLGLIVWCTGRVDRPALCGPGRVLGGGQAAGGERSQHRGRDQGTQLQPHFQEIQFPWPTKLLFLRRKFYLCDLVSVGWMIDPGKEGEVA